MTLEEFKPYLAKFESMFGERMIIAPSAFDPYQIELVGADTAKSYFIFSVPNLPTTMDQQDWIARQAAGWIEAKWQERSVPKNLELPSGLVGEFGPVKMPFAFTMPTLPNFDSYRYPDGTRLILLGKSLKNPAVTVVKAIK